MTSDNQRKAIIVVGSYTSSLPHAASVFGDGITFLKLDRRSGNLEAFGKPVRVENASWITSDYGAQHLYSIVELDATKPGRLVSIDIRDLAKPYIMNSVPTGGLQPCHVTLWNKRLIVSHFGDGKVTALSVLSDGTLGSIEQTIQLTGNGSSSPRQRGPHAHQTLVDYTGRTAYVTDLGYDTITRMNIRSGHITRSAVYKTATGSGPRHLSLSGDGTSLFVDNELNSTVNHFQISPTGDLVLVDTCSTKPRKFQGDNTCSEILYDDLTKSLFILNRGSNTVAVLHCSSSGLLEPVGFASTQGVTPRSCTIDVIGRYLLVANQDSNSVAVYQINDRQFPLSPTSLYTDIGSPCFINVI